MGEKRDLSAQTGELARILLSIPVGAIGQHLESFSWALKFLETEGAVILEDKGEQGLFLRRRSTPQLWKLSGLGTVVAVLPLPFSSRLEGLATGLHAAFADAGIPFSLAFIRGATKRVEVLMDGRCDIIMTSKMAARLELEQAAPITLIHEFGPKTYVKEHVAVFRDPDAEKISRGMRVALDPVSIDQTILTSYECEGVEVEFVEAPYAQTFQKIRDNQLDAAIWTLDEMEERSLGFNIRPLGDKSPRRVAGEDTVAVLATCRTKELLGRILLNLVDFEGVQAVQRQVLDKLLNPSY